MISIVDGSFQRTTICDGKRCFNGKNKSKCESGARLCPAKMGKDGWKSISCLAGQQDSSVNTKLIVMAEKSLEHGNSTWRIEKNSIIYQCNRGSCNKKSMADKARVIINEQFSAHLLLTGTLTDDQKIEIDREIALNPSFQPTSTSSPTVQSLTSTNISTTTTKISTNAARPLSARCLLLFTVALLLL